MRLILSSITALLIVSSSAFAQQPANTKFIFRMQTGAVGFDAKPVDDLKASFPSSSFTVGVPASVQGSVSGTSSSVIWTHQSGNLPNGLVFSSSGTLSGTPTTAGTFSNLYFKVTSDTGETNVGPVSLTVYGTLTVPPINVVVAKNIPISPINISPVGGAAPYTAAIETNELPNGLALSGLTVSGTIDASAESTNYSTIVDVSDSRGQVASTMMNIDVMGPLNISENAPPLPIYRGVNYMYELTALGGMNITPVNLDNPAAAPGMSMSFNWSSLKNQLTGLISTVPNLDPVTGRGSTTLNFSASDALGQTATFSRTFEVWDLPSFAMAQQHIAYEEGPINVLLAARNAVGAVSYADVGSLPSFLQLGSADITGVAPAGSAGTYPFKLRITDSLGRSFDQDVSISIHPSLKVSDLPIQNLNFGDSINIPFTISGGTGDYRYSIQPRNPGIVVDIAAGRIYGTPDPYAGGTYTIIFEDTHGTQVLKQLQLNIDQPPGEL